MTEGVRLDKELEKHKASKDVFSLFEGGIKQTTPSRSINLQEFLEIVKKDNLLIEQIRKEPDKVKRDKLKANLSYVTFAGVFSSRANNNLIKSSGFACLDIDGVENLEELRQKVILDKFTHCVFISPSGNGFKLLVKIPEVLNDGEYKQYWNAIAQHYNFEENDESTKDISRACYLSVDKKPYFNQNSEVFTQKAENRTNSNIQTIELNEEDKKIITEIKGKWLQGDRQNLTLSLAGYLRKEKRFGFDRVKSIVQSICQECDDIDIDERLRAVQETFTKDENQVKGISGLIEREIKVEEVSVNDFLIFKKNKKTGEEEFSSVNIDKVAEYIEDKFNIRTIFGLREETIEVYNEGIWTTKGRGIIKAEVERILEVYAKNNVVSEVLEKIKRRTEISREEADNIPDYKRGVENGVLDLENVNDIKFLPHSKGYNFRNKYPMSYIPEATCPKIQDFINKTFYEEDVPKVQEWMGFHLIRRYEFKRAVIIHGAKNTGKSVFLNLLNIFVNHNVSGLALQEIAKGKPFDLLVLKDKDANIHDDMSSQDMKSIGGFKMAVGDGFISGEQKFGDKIRFRNTAKDTNACNKLPNPGEDIDDEAYYERILLIPADNTIPKKEQKKNLIDEITTPEELSGLLNWAIEGYKRLVNQNGFSNEKSPEETKFLMLKNGNSLAEFASEVLVESAGEKVTKDEMYMIYCKWCLEHKPKLSPDSKDKIGKNLVKFTPFVSSQSSGKERYWLNVKITDSYDTFLKNIRNISEEVKESKNDVQNNIYVFSKPVIAVSEPLQNKVLELPQSEPEEDYSENLNWEDSDQ